LSGLSSQRHLERALCCAVSLAQAGRPLLEIGGPPQRFPPGSGPLGHDQRQLAGSKMGWETGEPDDRARPGPGQAWPWRGNLVAVSRSFRASELSASGSLPCAGRSGEGWWQAQPGPGLRGAAFALQRLSPCSGLSRRRSRRQRQLAWSARRPGPDVQLTLPQSRWRAALAQGETWRGSLTANSARKRCACEPRPGTARRAACPPLSGTGCRKQVVLERREGQLRLVGSPQRLPMGGGAVSLRRDSGGYGGPRARPTPIGGRLSGPGQPRFPKPLAASGSLTVEAIHGAELLGKKLTAQRGIRERLFQLKGSL